jgi:hypothetical protein
MKKLLPCLIALACSSNHTPPLAQQTDEVSTCYVPPPVGNIVGLGFNGQPRMFSANPAAAKAALDLLVNDLGASMARVEVNNGETDWEATQDDGDPNHFAWGYFDAVFSTPMMQKTWDYVRYLNQLGVEHIQLSQHGGIPLWMGTTSSAYPQDGRAYVLPSAMEDEFVETCVAMLVYARTRTAAPHPQFDLFSPWNEPEFATLGEGIDTTSAQRTSVLHKLVVRMNAIPELTGIQLSVGEDGSEPGMIITRQAVASDSLVMARTAATSYHRYSDGNPQVFGDWRGANPPVWLTELNSTWLSACYDTSWSMGLEAAGNLLSALKNGATAGLVWSDYDAPHAHQGNAEQTFGVLQTTMGGLHGTQLCSFSGQPSDSVLDATTYAPKPTYYALRHFVKWIRPNASPLAVTASGVSAVAYQNADGTVAVAGVNNGATTNSTVTLTMQNPPGYLTPRVSTATSTDVVGSAVPLTNGQGVFSFPSSSVFTLLSSPGSGGSGGVGGMGGSGGAAGASTGMAGAAGLSGGGGAAGADQGGMSGGGGASAGAGGVSGGQGGQAGSASGAGGAGAGGQSAGASGAGAAGQAGTGGSAGLPGLVAAWEFDEATGTTTADASGHGHTGTIASGVTWVTTGCKFGACLSFPGTSGKNVTVADANDLDLGANFTVMAWVLPTTTSGWRPVLIKENASSTEAYLLYSNPSNQGAYFTDSNGAEWSTTGTGNVSTTQWSHVAMTKNGTTLSYWVNGSVVGSMTVSSLAVKTSTGILAIGGHTFWTGEWFSGKLDDVRCYAAALSSSQIAQAMGGTL